MTKNAAKSKPAMKRVSLNHGGKLIHLPQLSGPVGEGSPSLLAKYPNINQPADVAIVDYYLSQLEGVRALAGSPRATEMGVARLLGAVTAVPGWDDRNAAIASLQSSFRVKDKEEIQNRLIKPGGETLKELVDNGDVAEKLLSRGPFGRREPWEYIYTHPFDRQAFRAAYHHEFSRVAKYNAASIPALITLLGFMENDSSIMDVRWMAYMLATAFVESSATTTIPGRGKARPVRVWRNFSPVEEKGHGRGSRYQLPVKVKRLADGTARVTEQDGDQFIVKADASIVRVGNQFSTHGAPPTGRTVAAYLSDDGIPKHYFGRGYVQLTWWDNYASAGVLLGRGLYFLFNPDVVMEPKTAYQLMAHCMRTGAGFANGHRFSQYFFGTFTNYFGARDMVNAGGDHHEVADAARLFENVLFASKFDVMVLRAQ